MPTPRPADGIFNFRYDSEDSSITWQKHYFTLETGLREIITYQAYLKSKFFKFQYIYSLLIANRVIGLIGS